MDKFSKWLFSAVFIAWLILVVFVNLVGINTIIYAVALSTGVLTLWNLLCHIKPPSRLIITTGVVIEHQTSYDEFEEYSIYTLIEFKDQKGQTIQFRDSNSGNRKVGSDVCVLYDPARPQKAKVKAYLANAILSAIFCGISVAIIHYSPIFH